MKLENVVANQFHLCSAFVHLYLEYPIQRKPVHLKVQFVLIYLHVIEVLVL